MHSIISVKKCNGRTSETHSMSVDKILKIFTFIRNIYIIYYISYNDIILERDFWLWSTDILREHGVNMLSALDRLRIEHRIETPEVPDTPMMALSWIWFQEHLIKFYIFICSTFIYCWRWLSFESFLSDYWGLIYYYRYIVCVSLKKLFSIDCYVISWNLSVLFPWKLWNLWWTIFYIFMRYKYALGYAQLSSDK